MSVDEMTGSLLDLIVDCWTHESQRAEVERVILQVGAENAGKVDPNVVRKRLPTWIQPQIVGPTYRKLCRSGVLLASGWVISDDIRGRNSGKPAREYRLVER
jgi:hypothetical protein